jgi:hypothetical protein
LKIESAEGTPLTVQWLTLEVFEMGYFFSCFLGVLSKESRWFLQSDKDKDRGYSAEGGDESLDVGVDLRWWEMEL